MDIASVLRRAWEVFWKHKTLWIFGILSSCNTGPSFSNSGYRFSYGELGENFDQGWQNTIDGFNRIFATIPSVYLGWIFVTIAASILIFALLILTINIFGRIGLIKGTIQINTENQKLSFVQVLKMSTPYFWRIVGLNLLLGLGVFILVLSITIPMLVFGVVTLGLGFILLLPLLCVIVPFFWFLNLIILQTNIALIAEDTTIPQAVKAGWHVVRTNLIEMTVMLLILGVGRLIVSFFLFLPMIIIFAPALFSLLLKDTGVFPFGLVLSSICFIGYVPLLIFIQGLVNTYTNSAWTLAFVDARKKDKAYLEQEIAGDLDAEVT